MTINYQPSKQSNVTMIPKFCSCVVTLVMMALQAGSLVLGGGVYLCAYCQLSRAVIPLLHSHTHLRPSQATLPCPVIVARQLSLEIMFILFRSIGGIYFLSFEVQVLCHHCHPVLRPVGVGSALRNT